MSADTFTERYFHAQDGLRLYYRDYGDRHTARLPLLCLSGVTRSSKDFHEFALRQSTTRRVLCLDYRGRGRSAYAADPMQYDPTVYLNDIQHLLAVAHIQRFIAVGTSLGGIMTMALAAAVPTMLAAAILNDIGPDVNEDGRQRIAGYVGNDLHVATPEAAIDFCQQNYSAAYPKLGASGWQRVARGTFTEDAQRGGLRLDYDLKIAVALAEQARHPLPDLWPLFRALRPFPLLVLRGALSDILTAETFIRMKREHAGMLAVTIPDVGHVPMLDEPAAETAIDGFLAAL